MFQSQGMIVGQKEQYVIYQNIKPMLGSQGQVYFGKNLQSTQEVAIKLCVLDDNEKHFLNQYMEKKQQKTPQNLVNILDFYQQGQNNQYIIIMERADCGDLQTFLKNSDYLKKFNNTKQTRIQFLKDIATGVKELHEMGIIHRDIKPENVLVFSSSPNQFICKICDFGLAKKADNAKTQQIGTPYYMAPELLLLNESYTNSVDIWALGCLFYEILAEQTLFNGKTIFDLMKQITSSTNKIIENRINEGLKDCGIQNMTELIQKMVRIEGEDRINIKEVMTYIYSFKGIQIVKAQDKSLNQSNQVKQLNDPKIVSQSKIKIKEKLQTSSQQVCTEDSDNRQTKQIIYQQDSQKQFDQIEVENQIEQQKILNNLHHTQQNNQIELQQDAKIDQNIQNYCDLSDECKQQEQQCNEQLQQINNQYTLNNQHSTNDIKQNFNCDDQFNQNITINQKKDCEYSDCQMDQRDNLNENKCKQKSPEEFNQIKQKINKKIIEKIFNNQHEERLQMYVQKIQINQNEKELDEIQTNKLLKQLILNDIKSKLEMFTYSY